jgi:effector-binding domain-containing protein
MLRNKYILIIITLILGSLLYFGLQPKWQKKTIKIEATSQDILDYIELPKNITKWLSPFKDSLNIKSNTNLKNNDAELLIKNSNLIKTEWEYIIKQKRNKVIFKIVPTEDGYTKLECFYKASWFESLLGLGFTKKIIPNVQYLKIYLETPKLFYNLDIEKVKVTDTLFIVSSKKIPAKNAKEIIGITYNKLLNYANTNALGFTGVRIIHEKQIDNNFIELYAGIGIAKYIQTKPSDSISIMQMPIGNLLIANYKGKFTERHQTVKNFIAYAAKNKYLSMAIPFEKWNDSSFLLTDTGIVKLQICLPFY